MKRIGFFKLIFFPLIVFFITVLTVSIVEASSICYLGDFAISQSNNSNLDLKLETAAVDLEQNIARRGCCSWNRGSVIVSGVE